MRLLPVATAADPAAAATASTPTLDYLEARRDELQHHQFIARGPPIGDGEVESANKRAVEARLKGGGMR